MLSLLEAQGSISSQGTKIPQAIWLGCPKMKAFLTASSKIALLPSGSTLRACFFLRPILPPDITAYVIYMHAVLSPFSRVQLCATLWTAAFHVPLSMGFSRKEKWSGLPSPLPGDLPEPEIGPASLMSPALAGGFFTTKI